MNQRTRQSERRDRGGFTLMEVLTAAGIIGGLFAVTIPLLGHVRIVRQEAERRMIAGEESANIMEAVAVLARSGALTPQVFEQLTLSPAAGRLPDGSLAVELSEAAAPFSGQQVTVRISWTNDVGDPANPIVLTAWFPQPEGEPQSSDEQQSGGAP
jgi:type II secretory pathway pseudopilin PulG